MTKTYFFKDHQYQRHTIGEGPDPGYPRELSNWHPFLADGVDAAVNWGIVNKKHKIYFFKGSQYLRWAVGEGADSGYPKPSSNWGSFFASGLDAAVNWGIVNGKPKAYFFKGSQYLRWTIGEGADSGYPRPLSNWHPFLANGIDAAVNLGKVNGKPRVYFVKGTDYLRWTIGQGADSGYPQPLSNLGSFLADGVDAAVNWSKFTPHLHGFHFLNSFQGLPVPINTPTLPGLPPISASYGLCGGMAAAAADFYLARRVIPQTDTVPNVNTALYQYLYHRLLDTFGAVGENVVKMGTLMSQPDGSIWGVKKANWDEFHNDGGIYDKLRDGRLVVLGLVRLQTLDSAAIWKNHQVLAYGYKRNSNGDVTINIYDPNYPDDDDIYIEAAKVTVAPGVYGFSCSQSSGDLLRGFFPMAYVPENPPSGL